MSVLNQFKAKAARIADTAIQYGPHNAASDILTKRTTKGQHAALMGALVIGTLCERGKLDLAQQVTKALAIFADQRIK